MIIYDVDNLVLYIDDQLLVVNKPAGLPTLVDGFNPGAPYLVGILKMAYQPLWVVHRLDRGTSGVIVFARNAAAHRSLNTQFEKRQATKTYRALVQGEPEWEERQVELPLRPNGDRRHRTVIDHQGGKPAVTSLRILERYGRYALVEAVPRTGRTHQIRAHLAALGHPIIADELYGGGKSLSLAELTSTNQVGVEGETILLARPGLHAWSLHLLHPFDGMRLYFEAPYPADFAATLEVLRPPAH